MSMYNIQQTWEDGTIFHQWAEEREKRRVLGQHARTTQALVEAMVKPHFNLKVSHCTLSSTHLTPRCTLKSFVPQYVSQVCIGLSNTSLRISRLNMEIQSPNLKIKCLFFRIKQEKHLLAQGQVVSMRSTRLTFNNPKTDLMYYLKERKKETTYAQYT